MKKSAVSFRLLIFLWVCARTQLATCFTVKPISTSRRLIGSASSRLHVGIQPNDFVHAHAQSVPSFSLLANYANLLAIHPVTTKATTAAILCSIGDAIAQWRSGSKEYDLRRGIAFLVFGALYTGCFQHFWFSYLLSHIEGWGDTIGLWQAHITLPVDLAFEIDDWWRYFDIMAQLDNPPSPQVLAAAKVVINQFGVIPIIYMPLFLVFTGIVSGMNASQTIARAKSLYWQLLQRNWLFWLPTQFLQFLVIPTEFQIPFLSMASLLWTIILSSIGGSSTPSTAPSTIVAYETSQDDTVTVLPVEVSAANQITDAVLLEDVQDAIEKLLPERLVDAAKEVTADARAKYTAVGFSAGLLASAADEGALGAVVGSLVGAEEGIGVAAVAAVSAGVGFLAAQGRTNSTAALEEIVVDIVTDSVIDECRSNSTMASSDATQKQEESTLSR